MHDQNSILVIEGQGAVGVALWEQGSQVRQGMFVRNRLDGSSRLVFDLFVDRPQEPVTAGSFGAHPCRMGMEFSLASAAELPKDCGALISRRRWNSRCAGVARGVEPSWGRFDDLVGGRGTWSTIWRQSIAYFTRCVLTLPRTPSEADPQSVWYRNANLFWRLQLNLVLVDCHEDFCLVSREALTEKGRGGIESLAVIDQGTAYFPAAVPLSSPL